MILVIFFMIQNEVVVHYLKNNLEENLDLDIMRFKERKGHL